MKGKKKLKKRKGKRKEKNKRKEGKRKEKSNACLSFLPADTVWSFLGLPYIISEYNKTHSEASSEEKIWILFCEYRRNSQ